MYNSKEVIEKFWTYIDEVYTGYWESDQLQRFADKALWNMVERKSGLEGYFDSIDDQLMPITRLATGAVIGTINLTTPNYRKLGFLEVDYGHGNRQATPNQISEKGDVYSSGTAKYPKYFRYSSGGSNFFNVEPSLSGTYNMLYFVEPSFDDNTRIVADPLDIKYETDLRWSNKFIELVIDEMVKIASDSIQDQYYSAAAANSERTNP